MKSKVFENVGVMVTDLLDNMLDRTLNLRAGLERVCGG